MAMDSEWGDWIAVWGLVKTITIWTFVLSTGTV